jgi:hypothetical protein
LVNLSNPCLNRWGFNIFWTKFWYSDNFYSQNLQHDIFFEKLIYTYLTYGISLSKKNITNAFWFAKDLSSLLIWPNSYYRWYTRLSSLDEHSGFYKIRKSLTDIYYMRCWVFKFMNWTVINIYWFRSTKTNKLSFLQKNKILNQFSTIPSKDKITLKRLKFFISKDLAHFLSRRFFYKF